MKKITILAAVALSLAGLVRFSVTELEAQARDYRPERPFGTLREQARTQQAWLAERLETNLPMLMRKHGVDMWVVAMREYNEDPVFPALVSPTTFAARRRTIYIFHDRGPEHGVERLALGGSSQGGVYEAVRATATAPDGRSNRGPNHGKRSGKFNQGCTICVCRCCTGPCWTLPQER